MREQAEKKLGEVSAPPDFAVVARMEIEVLVLAQRVSREALAEKLGVSGRHLGRLLAHQGLSYRELVDEVRMNIARQQLRETSRTVSEIGLALGFAEGSSFVRWFRAVSGKTPGEFREGGG